MPTAGTTEGSNGGGYLKVLQGVGTSRGRIVFNVQLLTVELCGVCDYTTDCVDAAKLTEI